MEINRYDEVPYTSYPYPRTHPDRLRTLGMLFGLQGAPVEHCRVLELGCASGGNLIPMAELLRGSEFIGIDGSRRQIEEGQTLVQASGATNVTLRHLDIREVDDSLGDFDYILCHGVYSWVSDPVRRRILEVFAEHLRPAGIGYVSYNVYPGWHLREMVRHMVRYHVRNLETPEERTEQARALVDFLTRVVPRNDPYGMLLKRELAILSGAGGDYLYHEHLESDNQPLYFHEFAEALREHRLQYLGETDVHTMLGRDFGPDVSQTLETLAPDIVSMEQYMDFVRNRQFRATAICRADVSLTRHLTPDVLTRCHVGFGGSPAGDEVNLSEGVTEAFETSGATLSSHRSLTKAALVVLRGCWPDVVAFDRLLEDAQSLLRRAGLDVPEDAAALLASDLLEGHVAGGELEVRGWRPPMTTRVSNRPRATAVARHQALRHGAATNLRHQWVVLDRSHATLLSLLDGRRDRAALIAAMAQSIARGALELTRDDVPCTEPEVVQEALEALLDPALAQLAASGFLLEDHGGMSAESTG